MYKPITVSRAAVANGLLRPLQCSDNMQLAINNSSHLTIMEPKLPQLHQCGGGPAAAAFDSAVFYGVHSVFHVDTLDVLGFQIFSRILVDDHESRFGFSRISEPQIVAHAWSPVAAASRDCYLGVLLNTGEAMVLRRDSVDAANWTVHFRSFTAVLDQMHLPQNRLTGEGDLVLSGAQLQHLKVTSFAFGGAPDGALLLLLAHESGRVSLHALAPGLAERSAFDAGALVVKMLWSDRSLYYVKSDNSVWRCAFDAATGAFAAPSQLVAPSRFLVSQLAVSQESRALLVTDTRGIHVISGARSRFQALPFRSVVTGLEVQETAAGLSCAVFFETGRFCVADCKNGLSVQTTNAAWDDFCSARSKAARDAAFREQNKAPSRVFQPYLEAVPEVALANFGSVLLANGLVAVAHTAAPQTTITHVIKSKQDYDVSFVPAAPLFSCMGEPEPPISALSHLSAKLTRTLAELPQLNKAILEGNEPETKGYLAVFGRWKDQHLIDASIAFPKVAVSDLAAGLEKYFRGDAAVNAVQQRYLFNIAFIRSLRAVAGHIPPSSSVNEQLLQLAQEQDALSLKLRAHLAHIVTCWAETQTLTSAADRFIVHSFQILLGQTPASETNLTLSTALCTETFPSVSSAPADFLQFAESASGHKWPRCDLTMLPIVDLVNKTDETETHKYLAHGLPESSISQALVETLNYCVFTGTRTFALKVGV